MEYLLIFNFKVYNLGTDEMTGIPYYYSVAVVKIRDNSSELIYLKVLLLYPSEEFKIILSLPEEEQLSHRLGPGSRLDYSHVGILIFHARVRWLCVREP